MLLRVRYDFAWQRMGGICASTLHFNCLSSISNKQSCWEEFFLSLRKHLQSWKEIKTTIPKMKTKTMSWPRWLQSPQLRHSHRPTQAVKLHRRGHSKRSDTSLEGLAITEQPAVWERKLLLSHCASSKAPNDSRHYCLICENRTRNFSIKHVKCKSQRLKQHLRKPLKYDHNNMLTRYHIYTYQFYFSQ